MILQRTTARVFLLLFARALAAEIDFSYDPDSKVGPDHWKDLEGAEACGGSANSPIPLETSACDLIADYEVNEGTCTLGDFGFTINHHVEQANAPSNGCETNTFKIPEVDSTFELLQFHIHTTSEHTLGDESFAGELHMVHGEVGGEGLAVIGIFISPTAQTDNEVFARFLSHFDATADATLGECGLPAQKHWWLAKNRTLGLDLGGDSDPADVYSLIPEGSTYYHYSGGLTTPPCSEIVLWNVVDQPLEISIAQYNDLSGLTLNHVDPETCEFSTIASPAGSTNRPLQAVNDRPIQRICPVGYADDTSPPPGTSTDSSSAFKPKIFIGELLVAAALGAAFMFEYM